MEAVWRGCALRLDEHTLILEAEGASPASIPLEDLVEFAVVADRPVHPGRERVSTPDARLVVRWREEGSIRRTEVPVPREALQVQLFLARLAQLRPEADRRENPSVEALESREHAHGRSRTVLFTLGALLAISIVVALLVTFFAR